MADRYRVGGDDRLTIFEGNVAVARAYLPEDAAALVAALNRAEKGRGDS